MYLGLCHSGLSSEKGAQTAADRDDGRHNGRHVHGQRRTDRVHGKHAADRLRDAA